jgi:hypothetical protein
MCTAPYARRRRLFSFAVFASFVTSPIRVHPCPAVITPFLKPKTDNQPTGSRARTDTKPIPMPPILGYSRLLSPIVAKSRVFPWDPSLITWSFASLRCHQRHNKPYEKRRGYENQTLYIKNLQQPKSYAYDFYRRPDSALSYPCPSCSFCVSAPLRLCVFSCFRPSSNFRPGVRSPQACPQKQLSHRVTPLLAQRITLSGNSYFWPTTAQTNSSKKLMAP